jgi:hypothetical protein
MTTKIPYIISEAHPDCKRSYLHQDFGVVDKNMVDKYFIEKLSIFICDNYNEENIHSVEDIENFFNNYYNEFCMNNEVWKAMIFVDNEWKCVNPSNNDVFEYIKSMKIKEEDYEELFIRMEEYIKPELDKCELKLMETMNYFEQVVFILNKCISTINLNKLKKNKELFYGFTNAILKLIEEEISNVTEELKKTNNEKGSLKLNYLMNMYKSVLDYKNILNSFSLIKPL